jgi:hypothetical protein
MLCLTRWFWTTKVVEVNKTWFKHIWLLLRWFCCWLEASKTWWYWLDWLLLRRLLKVAKALVSLIELRLGYSSKLWLLLRQSTELRLCLLLRHLSKVHLSSILWHLLTYVHLRLSHWHERLLLLLLSWLSERHVVESWKLVVGWVWIGLVHLVEVLNVNSLLGHAVCLAGLIRSWNRLSRSVIHKVSKSIICLWLAWCTAEVKKVHDSSISWRLLNRLGINTFWRLRNAYALLLWCFVLLLFKFRGSLALRLSIVLDKLLELLLFVFEEPSWIIAPVLVYPLFMHVLIRHKFSHLEVGCILAGLAEIGGHVFLPKAVDHVVCKGLE